jgi:hypothetical protein
MKQPGGAYTAWIVLFKRQGGHKKQRSAAPQGLRGRENLARREQFSIKSV